MVAKCGASCSKCGVNERNLGSSWCSNCINARKRMLRAEKKAKGVPLFGSNANPICNSCGSNKEPNYMNDSLCKQCRSNANKLRRQQKRIEEGKPAYGSGRSLKCSKCGEIKDEQHASSGYCRKCCSERKKLNTALKREDLGLKPWGSGRKDTCCRCDKIKENSKFGYCYSCHRQVDREWRLSTGRTLKHRTGACQCGKPFASYSNCYCVDCASEARRNYLDSHPDVKKRMYKKSNERRRNNPEEMVKVYVRGITRRAINRGDLVRKPCEICKTIESVEAHHDDYAKPLDVRWLCKKHHAEHHKNEKLE